MKGTSHENDTDSKTGHRINRPDGSLLTGIGLVALIQYIVANLERLVVGRVIAR
ncbi:MAG: hypothetical protein IH892_19520 [Planctomycetes bacterium]|nr:hypothetical protein [Planctomycetota bacterium]